jgi:hypothetical protein
MFLRIFVPPGARNKIWFWSWGIIWFNILYAIPLILVVLLQIAGQPASIKKINSYLLLVVSSVINVISDIVMLVIPLIAVWRLRMDRNKKLGISAIFAVGIM